MKSNPQFYLASQSPRRKELLSQVGYHFEVFAIAIDEIFPSDIKIFEVAKYLAMKKNSHYYQLHTQKNIVISADTTVICDDKLLEKPKDINDAEKMITQLSNKTHQVITGVCISNGIKSVSFENVTQVTFRELEKTEISYYAKNFLPLDKAGGYGIQEWIGLIGIKSINGSYSNVVGLPIDEVYQTLKNEFNVLPTFEK